MLFVTTAYGDDYIPFLTVLLSSINTIHPTDKVLVHYQDFSKNEVDLLKIGFPKYKFVKTKVAINNKDINRKIASKIALWQDILSGLKSGEVVCFLDSDMYVYKKITTEVKGNFDCIYTYKTERFPINTGVVIVKNSPKIKKLFKLWQDSTEVIINSENLIKDSVTEYGAPDQKSFADLIGKELIGKNVEKKYSFGSIRYKPIPCNILNQTSSVPLNTESKILHYKGGWRNILLEISSYTKKRSEEKSKQMKILWEDCYLDLSEKVLRSFALNSVRNHIKEFDWLNKSIENRGILNSEMLLVLSVVKELGVDLIIESGRFRGQSTWVLAEAFKKTPVKIISYELKRDENAEYVEKRLSSYKNLELRYGNSIVEIPELVSANKDKKIAILIDGPKGQAAFVTICKSLAKNPNISVGFVHDCYKSYKRVVNPTRELTYKYFDRLFFTDDTEYVNSFSKFDVNNIAPIEKESWKPYHKGYERIGSYGPTIGMILPNVRDVNRYIRMKDHANLKNYIFSILRYYRMAIPRFISRRLANA